MQLKSQRRISTAGPSGLSIDNKRKLGVAFILVAGSFLATRLCFLLLPNVFETWNSQTIDQLSAFRAKSVYFRVSYDNTVAHIDISSSTLQRLDNPYLDRSHFAQVVRNLAAMKVSAQVYDFIFAAHQDAQSDRTLIDATANAGNVYLGLAFQLLQNSQPQQEQPGNTAQSRYLDRTKWHVTVEGDPSALYVGADPFPTFPDLASASQGLGSLSVKFDRDGVLRRVPLLVRYDDAFYPMLPFRVICDYLGVPPEKIVLKPGKRIVLKGARRPGEGKVHDIEIPIDRSGNMVVNYIGPWERMDHYNFADILLASEDRDELELWGEELRGKIVVVSDVSTGSTDVGPVPTDANFPLSGLHANVMHTILTERFLRELSNWEMSFIEVLLLCIVMALSVRISSILFFPSALVLALGYIGVVMASYLHVQVILNAIRPLLMLTLSVIAIAVYRYINEEREKMEGLRRLDFVRDTFGRYLSNEVVEELLGSPEGLKMSGESREITLLVSDLRGFTPMSSKLSPNEVITILNRYFERMVDIIARYKGTVDELQGDGILALFGAPLVANDDPERAVACAVEMQNAMLEVNGEQRRRNLPELAMGIGINTGEAIVGNIGSEKRAKYGAVGNAINTAYRIESATIGGQILISALTYEKVSSLVKIHETLELQFKGIDRPLTLYDVSGIGGKYQVFLPGKDKGPLTTLEPPLPCECFTFDGKTASESSIQSCITRLSMSSAEVAFKGEVMVHSNLKILLTQQDTPRPVELYAKVLSLERTDASSSHTKARVAFTWVPGDTKVYLEKKLSGELRKENRGDRHE